MPNKQKVRLGISELKKLSEDLKRYQKGLKVAEAKIVEELVNVGVAEASNRLAAISNYDGNDPGTIEGFKYTHTMGGSVGAISSYGPQVVFLEFGTGVPGETSPHPQADDIGYLYNQKFSEHAHRTVNGVEGWFYKPLDGDEAIFTPGIRPGAYMWGTALSLRRIYIPVAKRLIKGAW